MISDRSRKLFLAVLQALGGVPLLAQSRTFTIRKASFRERSSGTMVVQKRFERSRNYSMNPRQVLPR